jgi:hypothetical protein
MRVDNVAGDICQALPSGENLHTPTPRSCPLYVWMHPLRRMSQIFKLVSREQGLTFAKCSSCLQVSRSSRK